MASEEQEQVEVEVMEGMNEEEDAGGSNMVIIIVVVLVCVVCVTLAGVGGCWFMGMLCFAVDDLKCKAEGDACKSKHKPKKDAELEDNAPECGKLILKDDKTMKKDDAKTACEAPVAEDNKAACCKFTEGDDKKRD